MSIQQPIDFHAMVWNFEKLHGSCNWKAWSEDLKWGFDFEEWLDVLTEDEPEVPKEMTEDEAKSYMQRYDAWLERNRRAMFMMYKMCDGEITDRIAHCKTVKEAYEILQKQYYDNGSVAKHHASQELMRITIGSCNNDVETYIERMQIARNELNFLKSDLPEWWFSSCLIFNLEGLYEDFVLRISLKKELPAFMDICAELRATDRLNKHYEETQAYHAALRAGAYPKVSSGNRRQKKKKKASKSIPN